ncbi:MAG: NAD(P)H-hydrate dehydratase [Candidatus Aenigmatarchaeota archaeon]
MQVVDKNILKKVYKKRQEWSKKYDFGHLLVVGGSKFYSGSPAFNALAALRAGVDLATIVAPEKTAYVIRSFKPDLIAFPIEGDFFTKKNLDEVLELTKNKTAVVIGGGMSRSEEVLDFILEFLRRVELPVVIDADAIHALAKDEKAIKGKKVVITPHSYEFFILSGIKVSKNVEERIESVNKIANKLQATVLLKGHIDVISNGIKTAINKTGSPYMTKGGLGDTLAGICGAYLARGLDTFTSACAAAFVNGKAGELAAKKYGESLLASDLIEEIPNVIKAKLTSTSRS